MGDASPLAYMLPVVPAPPLTGSPHEIFNIIAACFPGLETRPRTLEEAKLKKDSNIVRLANEMIYEHNNGLKGNLIKPLTRLDQKATQEGYGGDQRN